MKEVGYNIIKAMFLSKMARYNLAAKQVVQQRNFSKILKAFATVDPSNLNEESKGYNLVKGEWSSTDIHKNIIDPLTGKIMLT
jgi:hypothetical protein